MQYASSETILDVCQDSKYAYISINATYYKYAHAYSELCVSLAYSEPCHIPITKLIQAPRYIHNTILTIFTKAPSWTFDTILNKFLIYRSYLTSRVTLRYLLTLYFRYFRTYLRLIQTYLFLLRHMKNPGHMLEHSPAAILRHIF